MDDELTEYKELRAHLEEALEEKRRLDHEYNALQQEIYDKETEYFAPIPVNTASGSVKYIRPPGNIIKGFDGFSKSHHYYGHHRYHHYSNDSNNNNNNNSHSSSGQQQQQFGSTGTRNTNSSVGRKGRNNATASYSANDPLRVGVSNKDRIFSLSSASFVEQLQDQERRLMKNERLPDNYFGSSTGKK